MLRDKQLNTIIIMKKTVLLFAVLFTATVANSQASNENGINIGWEACLPVGDFGSGFSFGTGVSILKSIGLTERSALTITGGYLNFFAKENPLNSLSSMGAIQAKFGYRYYLENGIYLQPQIGANYFYTPLANNNFAFAYAPSIGYIVGGHFDITASFNGSTYKQINGIDINGNWLNTNSNVSYLSLRAAYMF